MDLKLIQVRVEEVGKFNTFQDWVNNATKVISPHKKPDEKVFCQDNGGKICTNGADFQFARDNNRFPVTVFRLIRNTET